MFGIFFLAVLEDWWKLGLDQALDVGQRLLGVDKDC
jgi:hypothetical protein